MAISGYPIPVTEHTVHANGIDIWYVEAGAGIPVILLHGGMASNAPVHIFGWGQHLDLLAEHHRVILPDTRGHGRTRNPSGEMSYQLFARDFLAFIEVLGLDHPFLGGFSDGGTIVTLMSMMAPDVPCAVVDWAGYNMLNPDPDAWIFRACRRVLGGSPDATATDLAVVERELADFGLNMRLYVEDFEPTQGPGYAHTYFEKIFPFWTTPMEYTFANYPSITAPMLMMFGDRDTSGHLQEAYDVYKRLPQGEFGIIPSTDHTVNQQGCLMALNFYARHQGTRT